MKISEFARANGVSVRTLHYYDEIGVLRPSLGQAENGYREYAPEDAQRLQAIRFYQTAGFGLQEASQLASAGDSERLSALEKHRQRLICQRDRLNRLIALLEPTPRYTEPPSLTARLSLFARAYHAGMEQAGFRDAHARALLSDPEWAEISGYLLSGRDFLLPDQPELPAQEALREIVLTQFLPATLARSILCEEALEREIAAGTRQAVLLAVGYDTLALRHPALTVYEVDKPGVLTDKRERLQRAGLASNAVSVTADMTLDDLPSRLKEAGFAAGEKAFFALLGVSYYLPMAALDALLADVASLSVRGTAILLDYADEGFLTADVPRVRRMSAMADAAGEPVRTCLSEGALAAMLARHGFAIYDHVAWWEVQARCLRETPGIRAFEHISCALAVFTG